MQRCPPHMDKGNLTFTLEPTLFPQSFFTSFNYTTLASIRRCLSRPSLLLLSRSSRPGALCSALKNIPVNPASNLCTSTKLGKTMDFLQTSLRSFHFIELYSIPLDWDGLTRPRPPSLILHPPILLHPLLTVPFPLDSVISPYLPPPFRLAPMLHSHTTTLLSLRLRIRACVAPTHLCSRLVIVSP